MNSMTGFGHGEAEGAGVRMSVELKTLNTRYLDIIPSLPGPLTSLEGPIRSFLQDRFLRGRVELSVRMKEVSEELSVFVDTEAAQAWTGALEQLAQTLGTGESVGLEMLVRQEGVLKTEKKRDVEAFWAVLEPLLIQAAQQVDTDRAREGKRLAADIEDQMKALEHSLAQIESQAPLMRQEMENSLRLRFEEILGDASGEARVLQEMAAWIVKTDINEEIVRLTSHIVAFREEAKRDGAVGKKLDFLAQEMGREINTIGSKSPRSEISREVVDMKDALEKAREQLRNVE